MKTTVQIEVEVPQDWIEFCTKFADLFSRSYCGYWALGAAHDRKLGWLVFDESTGGPSEEQLNDAIVAWKAGAVLPSGFYRLDEAAAVKAYGEGCKLWGVDWYDTRGDANTYDVVVQVALLGEVIYG
jgi:hypothetical protein